MKHREYYQTSYAELVQLLGEREALEKVRMYQSSYYQSLEVVKNSLLLQTYQGAGERTTGQPADILISVFYDKVNGRQLGIKNTRIKKDLPLPEVVRLIKSDTFKSKTEKLRSIDKATRRDENKLYKQRHFCYACFSGTFSYRSDKSLLQHSKLICIDLDDLPCPQEVVKQIADEADREVFVLCFISPNGDGVKVLFYADDLSPATQYSYYQAFSGYLTELCSLPAQSIDKSCKDTSRACFLPFDPDLVSNPKFVAA